MFAHAASFLLGNLIHAHVTPIWYGITVLFVMAISSYTLYWLGGRCQLFFLSLWLLAGYFVAVWSFVFKCVALLRMRFGRRDPSAPFALARRLYHAAAVRVTGATCTSHTAHRLSHDSTPA